MLYLFGCRFLKGFLALIVKLLKHFEIVLDIFLFVVYFINICFVVFDGAEEVASVAAIVAIGFEVADSSEGFLVVEPQLVALHFLKF